MDEQLQTRIDPHTNAIMLYLDKAREEARMLTSGGIIECMVRNPAVSEYINDLERRLEAADKRQHYLYNQMTNKLVQPIMTYEDWLFAIDVHLITD